MNLEALLTASLAHISFEKAVGTSYIQLGFTIVQNNARISCMLILGVAVRSGRLFAIAKAVRYTE